MFATLTGAAIMISACAPSPEEAGDACEPGGDPCPAGTVCAARDGDDICLLEPGQPCQLGAEENLCVDGSSCHDDGAGAGVCGVGEGGACSPEEDHCAPQLTCAERTDGTYACHEPVQLTGMVFDAGDESAIEGAHVIAFDEQATAVSDVGVSDAAGMYTIRVPLVRDENGVPAEERIYTLRASAQDYQPFPGGVRTALPIGSKEAVEGEKAYTIDTPLTDIALVPLPSEQLGLARISGSVEGGAEAAGVLVVAENGNAGEGVVAVSDAAGTFTIFNVPDGSYTVHGYAAGIQLEPVAVDVAGADVKDVFLAASEAALGSISGSVNIVNAPGGSLTSVVLVVESTFSDTFVKGEVPRGLRTPLSGPPDIAGAFTIDNVPAGRYVVLAAFENDDLVRDPDPNIAGTQLVFQEMPSPGEDIELSDSFKITEALEVVSPGAEEPEAVSGTPTFVFADDSGEDRYHVVVYDSFGDLVWEDDMVPGVSGSDTVSVTYGGEALDPGLYYQFRASSISDGGGKSGPLSTTEELRGVFFIE